MIESRVPEQLESAVIEWAAHCAAAWRVSTDFLIREVLAGAEVYEVERRMLLLAEIDGRLSDLSCHLDVPATSYESLFWQGRLSYSECSTGETVLEQIVEDLWLYQSALPGWPDRPP